MGLVPGFGHPAWRLPLPSLPIIMSDLSFLDNHTKHTPYIPFLFWHSYQDVADGWTLHGAAPLAALPASSKREAINAVGILRPWLANLLAGTPVATGRERHRLSRHYLRACCTAGRLQ